MKSFVFALAALLTMAATATPQVAPACTSACACNASDVARLVGVLECKADLTCRGEKLGLLMASNAGCSTCFLSNQMDLGYVTACVPESARDAAYPCPSVCGAACRSQADASKPECRECVDCLSGATRAYAASTQEAWDNHFKGFGGQNMTIIMKDYKEESVVQFYEIGGALATYTGLAEIHGMFTSLFADLSDLSTLKAPVIDVQDGMVFLVWEAPGVGYKHVTDTFLFDEQNMIHWQNIVAEKTQGAAGRRLLEAYAPVDTAAAWKNHFDAFGAQNLTKIMLDYDATSEVRLYNYADPGNATLFTGLVEIRGMFAALFTDLLDLSSLAAPVVKQEDGMVFLVWEVPDVGYTWVTDTFSFDENQKIRFQNIAGMITVATGDACDDMCGEGTSCVDGKCTAECPSSNECCTDNTCDNNTYKMCVGEFDAFCKTNWDQQCRSEAITNCGLYC